MKKEKRVRSWLNWLCMAVVMFGMILVPNISSKASNEAEACLYDRIYIDGGETCSWTYSTIKSQKSTNKRTGIGLYNLNEYINTKKAAGWKIKNVRASSSNKSVVAVSLYRSDGSYLMNLKLLKGGSSKITVTATAVKGKKKNTYKQTFTMKSVKYENPFKSLKIGGKEYASKYKNVCSVTQKENQKVNFNTLKIKLKKGQKKPKFQYKLNKNWEVEEVYACSNDDSGKLLSSTLENNMALGIMVYNKKTGVTERAVITIGNGSYDW